MGSEQSKPTAASRTLIEERLRSLQLEKKHSINEDGFVEVEAGSLNEKILEALRHSPSTLDVDELEGWQTRLLEDPKNRLVFLSIRSVLVVRRMVTDKHKIDSPSLRSQLQTLVMF